MATGALKVQRPFAISLSKPWTADAMTYLIDRPSDDGQALHVLIVGVETYEGEFKSEPLTGVADAVLDLAGWLAAADARMLPPVRLGSVRLLLSSVVKTPVTTPTGARIPEAPTRDNVVQAMEEWIERCAAGGFGILCWTGHGGAIGRGGLGAVETLFCSDSDKGRQRGIAWRQTLNAINSRSGQAHICCFVDACRTEEEDPMDHPTGLSGGRSNNLKRRAFVHYGAALGGSAWSYPVPIAPAEFPGGPLATRALKDALDRFGGSSMSRTHGVCSTPNGLQQALAGRIERWAKWIAAKEMRDVEAGTDHEPGTRFDIPLMRVPSPHCMVDVFPDTASPLHDLGCEILDVATVTQRYVTAPDSLQCSLTHGDYAIGLWSITNGTAIWRGVVPATRPVVDVRP